MNANDIILRMRQVYEVGSDSALAAALRLAPSAPSNWRQRNRPPFALCAAIARERGISLDWLILGIGDRKGARRGQVQDDSDAVYEASPDIAGRITRFVMMWGVTRSQEELIWLEQHLKRTVPEYRAWLEEGSGDVPEASGYRREARGAQEREGGE